MSQRAVIATAVAGVTAALLALALGRAPALVWNTTASAPVGLYLVRPQRGAAVGDWVFVRPPARLAAWLATDGLLPAGALLLKRIAALAPSTVCRAAADVTVDGRAAALALARDQRGRPLPAWRGCRRLVGDELFLLNLEPHSLDSRYFGPISASQVVGGAVPLWVADAR